MKRGETCSGRGFDSRRIHQKEIMLEAIGFFVTIIGLMWFFTIIRDWRNF